MGLFDWLTGKRNNVEIVEDRVWLTKKAKLAGVRRDIARALGDPDGPDGVIVVAHFQECLDELRATADTAAFDDSRLLVTGAESLARLYCSGQGLDESRNIWMIVGELHPVPSHDDGVLQFARSLTWHVSLEDTVLKVFSGEWVEGVLKRLGMKEDEAIESRLVARRLRSALKKIASQATGDRPASSAAEWFERNCPQVWQKLAGCR
jgi:hypothetical protein